MGKTSVKYLPHKFSNREQKYDGYVRFYGQVWVRFGKIVPSTQQSLAFRATEIIALPLNFNCASNRSVAAGPKENQPVALAANAVGTGIWKLPASNETDENVARSGDCFARCHYRRYMKNRPVIFGLDIEVVLFQFEVHQNAGKYQCNKRKNQHHGINRRALLGQRSGFGLFLCHEVDSSEPIKNPNKPQYPSHSPSEWVRKTVQLNLRSV